MSELPESEEHKALTARTGLNLPAARQPPRLDSRLVQHQIEVEDDNRNFEHSNYWTSCCIKMDRRAVAYFGQMAISGSIAAFAIAMMASYPDDCATFSRYSPLVTLIAGVWLPQPQLRAAE
jgi:hypothetical protein